MYRGPSRAAEMLVTLLTPPAAREHVVGDLRERYTSPSGYLFDAVTAIPMVVVSRIRRTSDGQVFLMEAFVLYLSFLAAAWKLDHSGLLHEQFGYFRLAIPAFTALLAVKLEDAYDASERPSRLRPLQQTTLAMGLAFLVQGWITYVNHPWSLPPSVMIPGGICGIVLDSTVRMCFPSSRDRPRGIH